MAFVTRAKNFIKIRFPRLAFFLHSTLRKEARQLKRLSAEAVFDEKYRTNAWEDDQTVSGPGSNLEQTEVIREELQRLLRELGIGSMLDIPCGDFFWMRLLDRGAAAYMGADIVEGIIESNRSKYGENEQVKFLTLDLTRDPLPRADLVLCRDCLVHFSFRDIRRALKAIRNSGSEYLLTTTFTRPMERNQEIITGGWRPLNLQQPPFNFPDPCELINEGCPADGGKYADKCLGLWRITDLPVKG
ncbi:MAG: methyltransferase domain-containing protein [Candidatus Eisenbacteria sp.]|nr:methyltransferase domain-containing protein [Candidatus Eisenbacteria bacterium]